jgi:pimeloyl-ACP methyl ester carboxylesterase
MDGGTSRTSRVRTGPHELEVTVCGHGGPTVVVEPMLGGRAESWRDIAQALADDTTVVTYDRAPYGASSAARDHRTPENIARDLNGLLDALNITGPLILVGHSAGGVYVRAFATRDRDRIAGMVLVESSHEAQEEVLTRRLPPRIRLLEALTAPFIRIAPRGMLNGADRRSILRELRELKRLRAADRYLAPGDLGERPLIVLTRSGGEPPVHASWNIWHDLHADLARLSTNHRHVIADTAGHSIHREDPALVITSIRDVLHSARSHTPLTLPSPAAEPAGAA